MISFKQFFKEELVKEPGTQYGSNEGGVYKDSNGGKFYVKHYRNGDQAKVEALTGKLYNHMGIKTLNPEYKEINGKPSVVTPWNDNLKSVNPSEFEKVDKDQASQLATMHAAATLTKNWDIVGLEHDNIMKHEDGSMYAVDHGGAFHFRAQGGPKEYGPDVTERESLVNNNGASGHVFQHVFNNHPETKEVAMNAVRNIDDNHVEGLFRNSGLSNWKELHQNFMQRKENFLKG